MKKEKASSYFDISNMSGIKVMQELVLYVRGKDVLNN